jgi:hypothetical protein
MLSRLRHPSPAMLVAIVALVAAVSGSAVATVATTSVLNKKEKKQVKSLSDKRVKALAYTKQQADGRFLRGSQVTTSETKATALVTPFNVGNFTDVLSHSVTTPSAGKLLVFANLTVEDGNTGNSAVESRLLVNGNQVGVEQEGYVENSADFYSDALAPIGSVQVAAGTHSVKLQAYNAGSAIAVEDRSITTLFIPS